MYSLRKKVQDPNLITRAYKGGAEGHLDLSTVNQKKQQLCMYCVWILYTVCILYTYN
jgi:hypothetical protein